MPDNLDILLRQLKQLKELRDSGALADESYEQRVADLLAGGDGWRRGLELVAASAPTPSTRTSSSRRNHPSGGSALIATPLGTSSNSFAAAAAAQPPSPLASALQAAKNPDGPPDQPVERRSSYWSRTREGRTA
jgi:hypothetical protein